MEQSSSYDELTIRHQFDRICHLALKGEAINNYRHKDYRSKHEVCLSELSEKELNRFFTRDQYEVEKVVKAAKEKREPFLIPHFSCHHLRHTFCSRFCENETNLKVIQSIMGHANIETTMDIYTEVTDIKKC